MKIKKIIIVNSIIMLLFILIDSISLFNNKKEIDAWNLAVKESSDSSLNSYISKYPNGLFLKSANLKLDELTWKESKISNSIRSYQNYKNRYSNGEFITKADSIIEEIIWENAISLESYPLIMQYTVKYPNGKHIDKAKNFIKVHS